MTPERKKVEWKGTSMPLSGMVAKPRCRSSGLGLGLGLLGALLDDVDQVRLDVFEDMVCINAGCQSSALEVVGHVGEAVESAEVASATYCMLATL